MFPNTKHDRNRRVPVLTKWRLTEGTRNSEYELGDPDPSYKKLLESLRLTREAALHVVAIRNSIRVRTARFR